MCIGIPMQIIEHYGTSALCEYQGESRLIDMMLVGDSEPPGTWVLVFLDAAREILTEEAALHIADALDALRLTQQGVTSIEHLFADLVDREPSLPAFLQS